MSSTLVLQEKGKASASEPWSGAWRRASNEEEDEESEEEEDQ